jgi:RHS repeat-associated protein
MEQNIRLPGQYHDRETGLYYNYHRYYDPKIGCYINQDPIGLRGGLNKYQYVLANPVGRIDPKGLQDIGLGMFSPQAINTLSSMFSLAQNMQQNGANSQEVTKALGAPNPPWLTFECRASAQAGYGAGGSVNGSANELEGPSASVTLSTGIVGARAGATCGFKIKDPCAKPLPVAVGGSVSPGVVSVEVQQTSGIPEVYIGVGPALGTAVTIPGSPGVTFAKPSTTPPSAPAITASGASAAAAAASKK